MGRSRRDIWTSLDQLFSKPFVYWTLLSSFLPPFFLFFTCNTSISVSQNKCSIIIQQKGSSSNVLIFRIQYKQMNRSQSLDDVSSCGPMEVRELFRFTSDLTQNIPVHLEINNVGEKIKNKL